MTSAELAVCMSTNPVVVRRTMAGLREAGFVRSEKGHGGGWKIACDLRKTTMRDIYDALGAPELMAMGVSLEGSHCMVERAVNRSLTDAFEEAQQVLVKRLSGVTLATLAEDFKAGAKAHRARHK